MLQTPEGQRTARELLNVDERTTQQLLKIFDEERTPNKLLNMAKTAVGLIILFPELTDELKQKVPLIDLQRAIVNQKAPSYLLGIFMYRLYPEAVSKPSFSLNKARDIETDENGRTIWGHVLENGLDRCYQDPLQWEEIHQRVSQHRDEIADVLRWKQARLEKALYIIPDYATQAAAFLVFCADEVKFHEDGRVEVMEHQPLKQTVGLPPRQAL